MSSSLTQTENVHFLEYAIKRIAMAKGMTETHANCVADAICFAHIQGKLNQGLGVYECIELAFQTGALDVDSTPSIVNEGDNWAVFDGKRSTGYYALTLMAKCAIEKARTTGISIVFGSNHNDAGSFAKYVYMAYEQGMVGMASNNTVRLAAPYGGMENKLSCPPFDAIIPSGKQPPIWTSIKFAEFYDADIAEAVLHDKPMKGKWLIDPESGELTDDAKPYARAIPGFGRVMDATCGGQIETPRTYALNMWNEALTSIINPLGIPSTSMPSIEDFENSDDPVPSVGGSYFMCINPAVFGSLEQVKQRSDDYVSAIKNSKPRPGHKIRVPGEAGYIKIKSGDKQVEVLTSHWKPFFENIASGYGITEQQLRDEYKNLSS
jgi:LDH2 family malate/lactate/ureidoglycolate dehydrogenase